MPETEKPPAMPEDIYFKDKKMLVCLILNISY